MQMIFPSYSSDNRQPYTQADCETARSPHTMSTSSTSSESDPVTTLLSTRKKSRGISDRRLIPHSRSSDLDTVSLPNDIRTIFEQPTEHFIRTPWYRTSVDLKNRFLGGLSRTRFGSSTISTTKSSTTHGDSPRSFRRSADRSNSSEQRAHSSLLDSVNLLRWISA